MNFPVANIADRSVSPLGVHASPHQAVAAVMPAIALAGVKAATDPRGDNANGLAKPLFERKKPGQRPDGKANADQGSASAPKANPTAVGMGAGVGATGPRSSFTVSVEQIAAAAEARSMPFTTPFDQVQAGHVMISVDGGSYLIPVTGGFNLAQAAAAIRASEAPVDVALEKHAEGVVLSLKAQSNENSGGSRVNAAFASAGGPGKPLLFQEAPRTESDSFAVNRLLQDRMVKAGDESTTTTTTPGARKSRAHKAYAASAEGARTLGKANSHDPSSEFTLTTHRANDSTSGSFATTFAKTPAPVQHRAHAAYREVASSPPAPV